MCRFLRTYITSVLKCKQYVIIIRGQPNFRIAVEGLTVVPFLSELIFRIKMKGKSVWFLQLVVLKIHSNCYTHNPGGK